MQSSITPLQSSSTPLQPEADSAVGHLVVSVAQVAAEQTSDKWSVEHWNDPVAKQWVPGSAPLLQPAAVRDPSPFGPPQPAGRPTSGNGSSQTPLQSSS